MEAVGAWRESAKALRERGEYERAFDLLKSAADAGELLALVEIANLKWQQSAAHDAQEWLDRAERQVTSDNWETHYSLHWAYSLGVGTLDAAEKHRRAFEHLLCAAEWGDDPRLKLAVASHYRDGLNMVQVDLEAAERWFSLAAESKDPVALTAYRDFMRHQEAP